MSLAHGALQRAGAVVSRSPELGIGRVRGSTFIGMAKPREQPIHGMSWGSKPRGDGSEGWQWLSAISTSGEPLWGQQELLASPVLSHVSSPIAQAVPMRGCDGCMQ